MRNYEPNLIDSGEDWVVCKSEVVSNESEEMKVQLGRAYRLFKNTFTGCDSSLKNDGLTLDALPDLFSQQKLGFAKKRQISEITFEKGRVLFC